MVVRNPLQRQEEREGEMRRDPYVTDVDRRRICYSCGEFGYLMRNCKNQDIVDQERRIEYGNNLKEEESLESLVVLN